MSSRARDNNPASLLGDDNVSALEYTPECVDNSRIRGVTTVLWRCARGVSGMSLLRLPAGLLPTSSYLTCMDTRDSRGILGGRRGVDVGVDALGSDTSVLPGLVSLLYMLPVLLVLLLWGSSFSERRPGERRGVDGDADESRSSELELLFDGMRGLLLLSWLLSAMGG